MIKYHKIKNIYKRDEQGSRSLQEGCFTDKTFEMLKEAKWIWTEKVDGMNIQIHWDGYDAHIYGRTERAIIPELLKDVLTEKFLSSESEQLFEQIFGEKEVILFGEGYGNKIQKVGKKYIDGNDFILFDVYFPGADMYLRREDVADIAIKFGVQSVSVLGIGTLEEAVEYVKSKPVSTIGKKEAVIEGVICRPEVELYNRLHERVIVKIKGCDF